MNIVILLAALCSLDVTVSREIAIPRSIERTLVRIGAGLVESAGSEANLAKLCKSLEGDDAAIRISDARILVDGQRDGTAFGRVLRGVSKVGLFVVGCSDPCDSVELRYTLNYQGLTIDRRVTITEGQIASRASFACALGPQGRVRAISLSYVARESPTGTTITTAATVTVNSGICPERSTSRLRVVNRLAGRAAQREIDAALRDAIRDGQRLSDEGHDWMMGHAPLTLNRLLRWMR